jgi:TRAP-type C4-dicarboxylate transport system substrate-binding protein
LLLAAATAQAQVQTIKMATLAPEGSAWMKLLHEWGSAIERRAAGRLKIKFYAGAVAGDERDAVRKIRLGQLNAAAVSAVGLGLIQPDVRVLELPFLIRSYEELDHVRTALDAEIKRKFEDKGYVLVGWGDVGPVYVFSNTPLRTRADLLQTKLWSWVDDPMARAVFQELGVSGVPLGVPDVMSALQTGLINACYGSPLSTLALQWNTRVKYATSMIFSQAIGAMLVSKKIWDALSPDLQNIIREESRRLDDKLRQQVRGDNAAALRKMISQGLQVIETPKPTVAEFQQVAKRVYGKLDGQLYSQAFRLRVESILAQKRGGK